MQSIAYTFISALFTSQHRIVGADYTSSLTVKELHFFG